LRGRRSLSDWKGKLAKAGVSNVRFLETANTGHSVMDYWAAILNHPELRQRLK